MYTKKFNIIKDMKEVGSWLSERSLRIPPPDEMPAIGLIAYEEGKPVAAAFLRQVEGGFAQIDGLCSNPKSISGLRDKALDLVIQHLFVIARRLNIKSVIGFTADENTRVRSVTKHGFISLPSHTVVVASPTGKAF